MEVIAKIILVVITIPIDLFLLALITVWIEDLQGQLRKRRERAKERELARIRTQLQGAYLSCAADLDSSAYEARKAMIVEAYRLSQESRLRANAAHK